MWLMTVISGPVTGITILMWQLRDIQHRQMNWQKTSACASVFFHEDFIAHWCIGSEMLTCVAALSCVLLIKDLSKFL